MEEWKAAQPSQPPLFELKEDCRPAAERTAAGRYLEPTLFAPIAYTFFTPVTSMTGFIGRS